MLSVLYVASCITEFVDFYSETLVFLQYILPKHNTPAVYYNDLTNHRIIHKGCLLLLLQSALQPLMGFGLLYDFVPQSSVFTLLSPVSHFHLL